MKIRIAFYKGKGKWKEKIIRWWTKSPYSHAELIMPDNYTWISISPLLKSTVSSRIKTDFDLQKWDFVEFEITQEQHNVLLDFYDETKGCKYDWIGMIMSQLLPFHIKRKNKWYCSEWIAYALRIAGIINWRSIKIYDRCDLSPGTLYNLVIEEKEENIETSA
jgi:hypothetical protein